MERLLERLTHVLQHLPLDVDYLEFVCSQEMVFVDAISQHIQMPDDFMGALTELHNMIHRHRQDQLPPREMQLERRPGRGRPRVVVDMGRVVHLLEIGLPVACIANLLEVSLATLNRRMQDGNLSVRALYSTCTDEELDGMVAEIKTRMPHVGYRLVKGSLQAQGHRVQWERVRASMHRVDSLGILSRMTQLGCVVRRTYSVPCPKYLVHIDTNHKLIR